MDMQARKSNRRINQDATGGWRPGPWTKLALAVVLPVAAVVAGMQSLADAGAFPVRKVLVDGQFRHIRPEYIEALVGDSVSGGFFDIDIDTVRRIVLSQPWVRHASVQRSWPDTVRISVYEQEPVARWGEHALLNQGGEIFRPAEPANAEDLPLLIGPEQTQAGVLQVYRDFSALFAPLGLAIERLELNERRAWMVTLGNGLHVVLGRDDEMPRLRRLVSSYEDVFRSREGDVERIDLRYTNGFAVHWRQSSGKQSG